MKLETKRGLKEAAGAVAAAVAVGTLLYFGTEIVAWVRALLGY